MVYSYTQISQYLSCPRRYRYRYLDGWKEKDTRAAMLFGRAFEEALSAYFRREDPGAVLFREWATHRDSKLEYSNGTTWDRMLQQGASNCSIASLRMTAFGSASPGRTCRPSSHGLYRTEMPSLPMLTQSGTSTVLVACWSGRPLPAGIRKNHRAC